LKQHCLQKLRPDVGFVLVTFDPARDTPDVLSAYGARMGLDPTSWGLLSGQPDDVLELATLLGIKYKRDQSGGFIHSNVITVLNKAGEIVYSATRDCNRICVNSRSHPPGRAGLTPRREEEYYALQISRPGLLSPGYYRLFSRVSAPHH
jgi:hypothetical protein